MSGGYIDATWKKGPRVRLDSLKVGDMFLAADGAVYRVTGWYKDRPGDCPHAVNIETNKETLFAGSAEGVLQ